jgi:hypothetical protein
MFSTSQGTRTRERRGFTTAGNGRSHGTSRSESQFEAFDLSNATRQKAPLQTLDSGSRRVFRWERQLQASFQTNADRSLWCRLPRVSLELTFRESTCSNGRADLVWAGIAAHWPRRRHKEVSLLLRQPTCSRILAELKPRAARTEAFLARRAGVTQPTFRHWMRRLLASALARKTGRARYILGSSFPGTEVEFCAFEFKLNDWKRAFCQALRYRTFSHRVFVVMPVNMLDNLTRHVDRFKRFNVGLIAHCDDGTSETLMRPKKRLPTSRPNFIRALGQLIAAD